MDAARFDAMTRVFRDGSSRRGVVGGLAATLLGIHRPVRLQAKKKKGKTPQKNAFGCLNVGKTCKGKDHRCCSGICKGKKPKKGEQDKRHCVGHDSGGCAAGKSGCVAPSLPCTTSTGNAGSCFTTTGKAGYCRANNGGFCTDCFDDVDCQGVLGPSAACVVCTSCPDGTMCGSPTPIT